MIKEIHFDPSNFDGLINIMDEYGDSETMMHGKNENGEDIFISAFHDRITTRTLQSNGWERLNVYWRDWMQEELFTGRWK